MSKKNVTEYDDEDEDEDEETEEEEETTSQIVVPPPPKQIVSFQMIHKSEIPKMIKAEVAEASKFLVLPEDSVLALLIYMGWSKEKLNEKYFENPEKLKELSGIKASAVALKLQSDSVIDKAKKYFVCNICQETNPMNNYYALSCNHGYCRDCLNEYFKHRLTEGVCCIQSQCAKPKCNMIYPLSVVKVLLDNKDFARYEFFLHKSFLICQKNLKLCPAPNCDWMAKRSGNSSTSDVKCMCGYCYCFNCVRITHSPVPCSYMDKWEEKLNGSGLNDIWLITHTKKCPKCKVDIEKNEGCNHMTCRNVSCHHEFCWICFGDWKIHGTQTGGFYSCNRPIKKEGSHDKERETLEYFNHYYSRYIDHGSSLDFAIKQLQTIPIKQDQFMLTVPGQSRKVADFIREAIELVVDCRRLLRCSYILGFYLRDGAQKDRFEFQQQYVENYTEKLTEKTEKITGDKINRDDCVQYTTALNNFVKNIREYYSTEILQLADRK